MHPQSVPPAKTDPLASWHGPIGAEPWRGERHAPPPRRISSRCCHWATAERRIMRTARAPESSRRAKSASRPCANSPSCYSAAGACACSGHPTQFRLTPSRLDKRGASRSSRTLGAGCGGRECCERRARPTRTAKSCGPDAATLASSWRWCFASRWRRWQQSPFTGESAK